ncbi:helix-turn-helix domain-containing protein [Sphingobacterium sp. ML3W]|uniref:helix-turn-helix domain-containing protein n=1 Tax=Sphingobacterium sp. ML3W TaxID=1538644 RepID=UPI000B07DCB6|nr:helix-turn-helix transcriptional regulator [Sphingobacterium sp. ML3W]
MEVFNQIIENKYKMGYLTPLGSFLFKNKITQKYVSDSTGFTTTKVNKLYIEKTTLLYADEFYRVIKSTTLDFDYSCEEIFKNSNNKEFNNKWKSTLGILLFDYFKPQNYIEDNTGIDNVRLNKLLTDPKKRPYAEELNNVAKLMGIKPSQLFEYFYGDGERPVIGLLPKPDKKENEG